MSYFEVPMDCVPAELKKLVEEAPPMAKAKTIREIWETLNEEQKLMVEIIAGYIITYPGLFHGSVKEMMK